MTNESYRHLSVLFYLERRRKTRGKRNGESTEVKRSVIIQRKGRKLKRIHHFVGATQTSAADTTHTTDRSALPSGDVRVSQPANADKVILETQMCVSV